MEWPLLTDDDGSEWIGTERLGQLIIPGIGDTGLKRSFHHEVALQFCRLPQHSAGRRREAALFPGGVSADG
ncbi:hypothetical protein F2P79_024886 [Pimephales promelas]|nr:hypothetical protein F2P79_024886 [Pimephales promelas]